MRASLDHLKTSDIILRTTENPSQLIRLVQFEENFKTRIKMLDGVDRVVIGYIRPGQFLDHLTVIIIFHITVVPYLLT